MSLKSSLSDHQNYIKGIKIALNQRGMTYAELAVKVRMSESGIKKMLNAKDISFRRVLQICEALQITPGKLFSQSEVWSIQDIELNDTQQNELIRDKILLEVYWRFVVEKRDLEHLMKLVGSTPHETRKKLQRLVTLELIKQKKGKFERISSEKFRITDDSKLGIHLNKEWSHLTLARSLSAPESKNGFHRLISMLVSEEAYARLMSDCKEALERAVQASEYEELSGKLGKRINFSALVAIVDEGVMDRK